MCGCSEMDRHDYGPCGEDCGGTVTDKNCGTCHWRHWVPEARQWQCRKMECGTFGMEVAEADNPWCPTWAYGKQLGTPFSQLTQARFEEIGRTWGYD